MRIIITVGFFFLPGFVSFSQKVNGKLKLEQGQTVNISMQMKSFITQQAGGQAIDFSVEATGDHAYKVTNATADNNTLHHKFQAMNFKFDGWGRKINFDSKNESDLNGMFGKPIKEVLEKTYDMIIDSNGKVLMVLPEKIQLSESDSRMAIVNNLLKDIFDLVQPPQKGKASFFKVLPDNEAGKGDAWTTSQEINGGKEDAAFAISDINDSTIVVEFAKNSTTVVKAEMMGAETITTMNHKSTGKIILDRITGIIKEKNETIESSGNNVSSFGTLPVTSKTTVTITVRPALQ
ncbi:MAG: hypothetical protein HOP10_11275 [Chitinophagaceae bacterium]|nr:hypothetical protein [Chitinophagaceae bacterium]